MHPESGVPPSDARNSIPNEVEQSQNCDELWYSTSRCQPRFDPAAANAMLAELINLVNKGEVVYDCAFLNQVELSVRYLIQRGLPKGVLLQGGANSYFTDTDPPLTRYNDFMVLVVVPILGNQGPVTLDVNLKGPKPVLRNDGLNLEKGDWISGVPYLIGYWNDRWWMLSFVASQIPKIGHVITWIRTDGNDLTGDGTANTPDKAYRTIDGAWAGVGVNYVASPSTKIDFILGNAGYYEGGSISNFGGAVSITSFEHDAIRYIIGCKNRTLGACVGVINAQVTVSDVTLRMDRQDYGNTCASAGYGSIINLRNVRCEIAVSNNTAAVFGIFNESRVALLGSIDIYGSSLFGIGYIFICQQRSGCEGSGGAGAVLSIRNLGVNGAVASVSEVSLLS